MKWTSMQRKMCSFWQSPYPARYTTGDGRNLGKWLNRWVWVALAPPLFRRLGALPSPPLNHPLRAVRLGCAPSPVAGFHGDSTVTAFQPGASEFTCLQCIGPDSVRPPVRARW